jgi:hypothetical protein
MSPFQPLDRFELDGDGVRWVRASSGCVGFVGVATALLGLLFGVGGALRFVRGGEPLGALFALMGVGMLAFGVFLGFLRVRVRIDREGFTRATRALIPLGEEHVPLGACRAIVIRAGHVGTVRPGRHAPGAQLPTTSVQLELASTNGEPRYVGIATELDGPTTEASARRAADAVAAKTGLPVVDARDRGLRSPDATAPLARWAARLLGASLAIVLALAAVAHLAVPEPKSPDRGGARGRR